MTNHFKLDGSRTRKTEQGYTVDASHTVEEGGKCVATAVTYIKEGHTQNIRRYIVGSDYVVKNKLRPRVARGRTCRIPRCRPEATEVGIQLRHATSWSQPKGWHS